MTQGAPIRGRPALFSGDSVNAGCEAIGDAETVNVRSFAEFLNL